VFNSPLRPDPDNQTVGQPEQDPGKHKACSRQNKITPPAFKKGLHQHLTGFPERLFLPGFLLQLILNHVKLIIDSTFGNGLVMQKLVYPFDFTKK
jgi:hypothetical protein